MRITNEKFMEILKRVKDWYDDYVIALTFEIKSDEDRNAVIEFISRNPEATSSDVIQFYTENLMPDDGDYEYEDE